MADAQRGFNIGVFKAELNTKRVLRPNLFLTEFSIPPGMVSGVDYAQNLQTVKTLEYWCEGTTLPGFQLQTYQGLRYGYGSIESRPIMPIFGMIQFDFIFDSDSATYDFFFDWMNMIINSDMRNGPNETNGVIMSQNGVVQGSPFELAYKEDFVADVSVMVFDQEGFLINQTTLREAFPVVIGDIRLAWADNNSYMRLPISFAYNDWFKVDPADIPGDTVTRTPPNDYYNLK